MLRIRGYFLLMAARHLLLGLALFVSSETLADAPATKFLVDVAPIEAWAVAMVVLGALCTGGAVRPVEFPMRFVVVASSSLTAAVAACMVLALADDPEVTGVLAILFSTLAGKDLLVAGLKWRDPFEHLNRVRQEHGLEAL